MEDFTLVAGTDNRWLVESRVVGKLPVWVGISFTEPPAFMWTYTYQRAYQFPSKKEAVIAANEAPAIMAVQKKPFAYKVSYNVHDDTD